jgi:hypothetical protein
MVVLPRKESSPFHIPFLFFHCLSLGFLLLLLLIFFFINLFFSVPQWDFKLLVRLQFMPLLEPNLDNDLMTLDLVLEPTGLSQTHLVQVDLVGEGMILLR